MWVFRTLNKNFPLPHVFPPPPFPLKREPTASAPRGDTLGTRINRYRPLVMPLRFVRRLRNNTAQSLVLSVKLGARFSRRLAARTPNRQIPCIRTLRISVRLSACVQSTLNTKQALARNCGLSFVHLILRVKSAKKPLKRQP